jgi:hypothetical protein
MFQKIIKVFILITILFLFFSILSCSNGTKNIVGGFMFDLVNDTKKTVVFLGDINKEGNPRFYATGALVQVQNIYHLITAKHVVIDRETGDFKDDKMLVFFNSKDGGIMWRPIENIKRDFDASWIFHTNPEVDVAINQIIYFFFRIIYVNFMIFSFYPINRVSNLKEKSLQFSEAE